MTRINLVAPQELTNQHLMAEYRELPRIFTAVDKHLNINKSTITMVRGIPDNYCLGTGHVKFFYRRLHWLLDRYIELYTELQARGFDINTSQVKKIIQQASSLVKQADHQVDYSPTPEEIYINMYRLAVRHFKTQDMLFEVKS